MYNLWFVVILYYDDNYIYIFKTLLFVRISLQLTNLIFLPRLSERLLE